MAEAFLAAADEINCRLGFFPVLWAFFLPFSEGFLFWNIPSSFAIWLLGMLFAFRFFSVVSNEYFLDHEDHPGRFMGGK